MADPARRTLRERRTPRNHDPDKEDQDPWGYAKPTYSRPSAHQELRNPAAQLTADAKLLTSFLASIGKRLKDYLAAHSKPPSADPRDPANSRERKPKLPETALEPHRVKPDPKQTKIEQPKQGSDQARNQPQINGAALSYSKNEAFLNEFKARNAESAHKMLDIENSLKNARPPPDASHSKLQKQKPNTPPDHPTKKPHSTPKHTPKPNAPLQTQNLFSNLAKQNSSGEAPNGNSSSRKSSTDGKIFKRSAFHVAIAYHIYIKNMREKGAQGTEIDPTLNARKMRDSLPK